MSDEPECFLIRTIGGPHPGNRMTDGSQDWMTWPLPDILKAEGGHYAKEIQSRDSRVIRGVQYVWVPSE